MDRPGDSQKPPQGAQAQSRKAASPPSGIKVLYLTVYNSISALLWSVVLTRTLLIVASGRYQNVYPEIGEFTKWTQTLAALEVFHAATGIVRAPLFTTLMQVASRFLLVWGIVYNFPEATARTSPAYSSMLVAWSVTEVIRYSYFAVNLAFGSVPGFITSLRYNTFFVLYPMGISSECWLVWKALGPAKTWNMGLEYVLIGILLVYIPGSYILFTHMMAQRRKVLRSLREKKTK